MVDEETIYQSSVHDLVILSEQVTSTLLQYRQVAPNSKEAGGVLIGERRGPHLVVTNISEPGSADKRSRCRFDRKSKHHQKLIDESHSISRGKLQYLGEWHTHPERNPSPSQLDLASWKSNIDDNKPMIVIIVGIETIWTARLARKQIELLRLVYPHKQ